MRAASRRWPPKYESLSDAFIDKRINKKSGRPAKHYLCFGCKDVFPLSEIEVDHIIPVINPETGFISWDETIDRMFCEKDGFQILCKDCHKKKTNKEREINGKRKRI